MADLKNRITDLIYVDAADLVVHPNNWRGHNRLQADALRGVLAEVGIADALLAYKSQNSGKLTIVDGHLRKEVAPNTKWPVLLLDITDEEADYILATHDPLTAMAVSDTAALSKLHANIHSGEVAVLAMLAQVAGDAESLVRQNASYVTPAYRRDESDVPGLPVAVSEIPAANYFDATKLSGAQDGGIMKQTFVLYVSFSQEGGFLDALAALTLGQRTSHRDGALMAAINGDAFVEQWKERMLA